MLPEKKTIHLFLVNWIFQGKWIVAAADVRMLEVHVLGDGGEPSHWTHWTLQMGKCKGRSKHVHPNQYPQFPFCIHLPTASFLNVCVFFRQVSAGEAEEEKERWAQNLYLLRAQSHHLLLLSTSNWQKKWSKWGNIDHKHIAVLKCPVLVVVVFKVFWFGFTTNNSHYFFPFNANSSFFS